MLRKQLLEINSNNRNGSIDPAAAPLITASLMSNLPLTNRLGSPVTTTASVTSTTTNAPIAIGPVAGTVLGGDGSAVGTGGIATHFPILSMPGAEPLPDGAEKAGYQEQIKNALAKLLTANQQNQYELGSTGNTPEIPSGSVTSNSESSEINVKHEMDDIDVCRIDETLEVKTISIWRENVFETAQR